MYLENHDSKLWNQAHCWQRESALVAEIKMLEGCRDQMHTHGLEAARLRLENAKQKSVIAEFVEAADTVIQSLYLPEGNQSPVSFTLGKNMLVRALAKARSVTG